MKLKILILVGLWMFGVVGCGTTTKKPVFTVTCGNVKIKNEGEIDFGGTKLNTKIEKIFKIENQRGAELIINKIEVTSGHISDFSVDTSGFSWTISSFDSSEFKIIFETMIGDFREAVVTILTNSTLAKFEFRVKAEGFIGKYDIDKATFDFGSVFVNNTKDEFFNITNTGKDDLIIESIKITGSDVVDFLYQVYTSLPFSITPSNQLTFLLRFVPETVGSKSINIEIKHNFNPNPEIIQITGTATTKTGSGFQWARCWGDYSNDMVKSIITDSQSNVYTTGFVGEFLPQPINDYPVDFDPSSRICILSVAGHCGGFLSKFGSDGNLIWSRVWFGYGDSFAGGSSVIVDSNDNILVAGSFLGSVDFGQGYNFTSTSNGSFFIKYDSNGNIIWIYTIINSGSNEPNSLIIDNQNNIYITGRFYGTIDFGNGFIKQSNGLADCYLLKLDSNSNLLWVKAFGGTEHDIITSIKYDLNNHFYIVGNFRKTVDFGFGGITSIGMQDGFFSKYDLDGNIIWVKTWGGLNQYVYPEDTAINSIGLIFIAGYFDAQNRPVDFDPGPGIDNKTNNSSTGSFISKFDSNGNYYEAKVWFGTDTATNSLTRCEVTSIVIDKNDNIIVGGYFSLAVDFNPENSVNEIISNGEYDCFVNFFDPNFNYLRTITFGGKLFDKILSISKDIYDKLYFCGWFQDCVDFDSSSNTAIYSCSGWNDCFILKYKP